MYKILANGELIHASWDTNPDMAIGTPKLTIALNKAGSLEFTMFPRHPLYNKINKLNTLIEYYVDDEEVPMWYGRVLYTETDIWRQKKVCCEGALAFLLDSVQPYFDYKNVNPREFLVNCISHHNAQVVEMPDGVDQTTEWYWNDGINYGPIDKRFVVGDVLINEASTKYHFNVTGFGGTHGTIIDTLIKTFGGYLTVTRDHSTGNWRNRLDWRMDYDDPREGVNPQPFGEPNTQPVRYGLNLTDYTEDSQGMDVFTILLPIGKDNLTLETKGKDGETYNGGKMLIELTEQIATYGRVLRSIEFNQIDDAKELYDAAMKYLYEHDWRAGPEKYTVKAVDLHNLNQNEEPLTLGKKATLVIEPVGIERTNLVITEIQYDLDNPENDQYIFSKPHREDASGGNGASVTGDYNGTSSSSGRVTSGGSNYKASNYEGIASQYGGLADGEKNINLSLKNVAISVENATVTAVAAKTTTDKFETAFEGTAAWENLNNLGLMAGVIGVDKDNNVHIVDGSQLYLDEGSSSLGVYKQGDITAGFLVKTINGTNESAAILSGKIEGLNTTIATANAAKAAADEIQSSALWADEENLVGVSGKLKYDKVNNKIVVQKGTGFKLARDNSEFGVYDEGNLTGGVMIDRINDNSVTAQIKADRVKINGSTIDIGNNSSITNINSRVTNVENLVNGTSTIHNLHVGSIALMSDSGSVGTIYDGVNGTPFSKHYVSLGQALPTNENAFYVLANKNVTLNHSHIINASEVMDGNTSTGKIQIVLSDAIKVDDSQTGDRNKTTFDIASTAYCKAAVKAVKVDRFTYSYSRYDPIQGEPTKPGTYTVAVNVGLTNDASTTVEKLVEFTPTEAWNAGYGQGRSSGQTGVDVNSISIPVDSEHQITRNTANKTISFYPYYVLDNGTEGYYTLVTIDDPGLYNDGWHGAYNKIVRPATHIGNNDKTSFTVQIPQYAIGNQKTMPFSITSTSFSPSTAAGRRVKVNVLCTYDNQTTLAAVKTIDATDVYGYAWTQAVNDIIAPETYSGTADKLSFRVDIPTDTIDDGSGRMYFSLTGGVFASGATSTVVYAKQGDRIVALKNVDASGVYTSGSNDAKNAVILSVSGWNTSQRNTVTASNTAVGSGSDKSTTISMPSISINNPAFDSSTHKKTVTARYFVNATAVNVASAEIDASGVYTSGSNDAKNAVILSVSGWNTSQRNTVTASNTAVGSGSDKSTTISMPSISINNPAFDSSTHKKTVTARYFVNATAVNVASAEIDASGVYSDGQVDGWSKAAAKCLPPLKNTGSGNFSVTIPSASYGGADRTYDFSIACSFGSTNTTAYAYAYYGTVPVARITVDGNGVYNLGYSAASSLVTLPQESSGEMAVVRYPTFIDNYRSSHNLNLTLSKVDNDGDGNPVNKVFLVGNNGPNGSNLNVAEILIPAPDASITFSDIVPTAQGSDPKRITATASVVNGTSTTQTVEVSAGIYGDLTPNGSAINHPYPIYNYNDGSPIYTYHAYVQKVGGSRADHEQRSFPATDAFYDGQVHTLVDSATLYQSASIASSTLTIPLKLTYNWAWQSTGKNRVQTDKAVSVKISNSGYQYASDAYKKGNYNITIGGSNAFVVQPGGAWNAGWRAAQARCKPPLKNTSTNAFSVTIPNSSAPADPSVTTDQTYDFTITYGSVSNNKLPIYAKYGSVTVAQTTATVPSGSEPSASTIDLSNFGWAYSQQDVLNASPAGSVAQSQLTTLVNLLTSHKGQTGYIYFDARCGSGNTFKRYYLKNPT